MPKTNKVEHVFFDLDHTLWDFDKNSALTFDFIFKKHQVKTNLNDFLRFYEPINLKYWKLYRDEKVTKEDLRYSRLKETFDALQFTVKDQVINQLSEDYITYLSSFNNVFDGTFEILDYLKSKYKLHIITNGFKDAQNNKLKSSKLDHYFETVTSAEAAGVKKPNPHIFNFALNSAQAETQNSIMIGDNYEADILGALDIGLDAICFNYHKVEELPGIKFINHLSDIKKYL
ncbi:YjjG family noncanonical pyrimidine nucleotidase [Psychroserpens sp. NJDZ02]|uniref:YjjG family noncanonical pyrimidine nucleotidase n=1 Tax=Psychroserpens sp. NJDZ02 TaxID=2570561 RepID=UPI0010A78E22|nr:YjjG family noncanonical pyrimidine nucleotidase [Psychroserpens sp. NJDZ02]QCE41887.1 noncanonical pyrimidine nucleotidase, YjjG family [Psychroserpens sp. NJDZ02]